jgi:hypothetical protein
MNLPLALSIGLMSLAVLPAPARPAGNPVPGIPLIDHSEILRSPQTGRAFLSLSGTFPPSSSEECWTVSGRESHGLWLEMVKQIPCASLSDRWYWTFDLGVLDPGSHEVWLGLEFPNFDHDPVYSDAILPFVISESTPVIHIPYADSVQAESANRSSPPIYSADGVRVTVHGTFPTACYSILSTEALAAVAPSVIPTLRITVDRGSCRTSCATPISFETSGTFAPFGVGMKEVRVEMIENDCGATEHRMTWTFATAAFEVGQTPPCVASVFGYNFLECDNAGNATSPRLWVSTTADTALSALAGKIVIEPAQFRVVRLTPIGRAEGARVHWQTTPDGAEFEIQADDAPLPPCVTLPTVGYGRVYDECLVLEVELAAGSEVRDLTKVRVVSLASLAPPGILVQPCDAGSIVDGSATLCPSFMIHGARPNPFHGSTTIAFTNGSRADVDLEILDLSGRLVARERGEGYPPGQNSIHWDGTGSTGAPVPSGVYFARLSAQMGSAVLRDSRRLVLVRGN